MTWPHNDGTLGWFGTGARLRRAVRTTHKLEPEIDRAIHRGDLGRAAVLERERQRAETIKSELVRRALGGPVPWWGCDR